MKKIILSVTVSLLALSQIFAMSSDKVSKPAIENTEDAKSMAETTKDPHQLVDIYASDNETSEKQGSIAYVDRDKFNIIFCKENAWCEVVDNRNGNTGWINLEKLKESQQKYNQVMQKNANIDRLVQYVGLQDKKIVQLQQMIMQMQKEFSVVLQQQQAQINSLKQSAYY
ncbi:hypothetical protein [Francisella adeliensis]|uniref:SH3b domain-containing protein n=1 Tax=Francisella adeliensis TaxID=2007306 RepID=A0A2Z4XZN1_9GAMM|nr:hypothetical protein [Francisella adeliensis]AXA34224.1 hypothetical protein CDH04_07330 [Francisella adeliensis]MBK2084865.1 hypothetical protein [Francisella adeliensis]MBK2096304.1 hypothetical protein [Francisella adeliensis]QIW12468.1 hypothetical protein FZC43_07335 [Francisella adeliensis]QIW14341.1 hypothetical protein FZC44_07330 [Francisella adeliensis]